MIAVITAGGQIRGEFANEVGTTTKALAPFGDGLLIEPAIHAARACGAERIYIVGNEAVSAACTDMVDAVIPASTEGSRNIAAALNLSVEDQPLLLLTSDMPFISATALREFLESVGTAELAMPIADGDQYEAHFVGAPSHVTKVGNDRIANGNVFYFADGEVARSAVEISQKLFRARKSLYRMASFLDVRLIWLFLVGKLQISDLEAYCDRRLNIDGLAVRGVSPDLCFDIDTLEDYRYALTYQSRVLAPAQSGGDQVDVIRSQR